MEIRENTEQNNEMIHGMIRQHNAKFMTEFQDIILKKRGNWSPVLWRSPFLTRWRWNSCA